MLAKHARVNTAHWVCNYVPSRNGPYLVGSFDCSLFDRAIMETPFEGSENLHPDAVWWRKVEPLHRRIIELRGAIETEHLNP